MLLSTPSSSFQSCCDCVDDGRYIVTGQRGSEAAAVVSVGGDARVGMGMCEVYGREMCRGWGESYVLNRKGSL